jgi:hypothetical protein
MRTNIELQNIARRYGIPLYAVVSKDYLVNVEHKNNVGYIINMSNLKDSRGNVLEGTHWIGLYLANGNAFYYDSFGFQAPLEVINYTRGYKLYDSRKDIQNIHSGICGDLSLFFIMYMSAPKSKLRYPNSVDRFNSFLSMFSIDPLKNERILKQMIPWSI